jgi:hypothetical protein
LTVHAALEVGQKFGIANFLFKFFNLGFAGVKSRCSCSVRSRFSDSAFATIARIASACAERASRNEGRFIMGLSFRVEFVRPVPCEAPLNLRPGRATARD